MALVSYSDSEESDTETPGSVSQKPSVSDATSAPSKTKTSFQKVIDQANPRKVRVNLPGTDSTTKEPPATENEIEEDHPAKRARTTGAFSGFNAFLPAPKNASKMAAGSSDGVSRGGLLKNRGVGLGRGISLKTGAAPAFSREPMPEPIASGEEQDEESAEHSLDQVSTYTGQQLQPASTEEVKLVGKPMMFRPLSVARKGQQKKKIKPENTGVTPMSKVREENQQAVQTLQASQSSPAPKVKPSLFSTFNDDALPSVVYEDDRQDLASIQNPGSELDGHSLEASEINTTPAHGVPIPAGNQANNLSTLADNLGLSAAERRQLFGRNGSAQDARVSSFSLAAEYSHNNAMLESDGAAPAHNPVRAIAPGKHSLQQLLNAANNQKDALEESFATGKRNRKDAGSRYGW